MTITNEATDHDAEFADVNDAGEDEHQEADEADEAPELFYANVEEWVQGWFLPHFRRNPNSLKWRPDWWSNTSPCRTSFSYVLL